IGGKVGVNLAAGKNLAGAFHPAEEIRVCPEFLTTLPKREWSCGAAEVWKYGAIWDVELWDRLCREPLGPNAAHLSATIARCQEIKLEIVEQDPLESTGLRAILNFGHTIGHAIEWVLGYGEWTHGEAVAAGIALEADLAERLGLAEVGLADQIRAGLASQGLPVNLPSGVTMESLLPAMARDKKAGGGGFAFSLVDRLGHCKLVTGISESELRSLMGLP
ncbi:MAG: 3-dehydroquinate synthase, partial [Fimbriimonadaceae bacterium]|nr:3-dehydroquinate synthase [Fimbriimonadaceae bacterium]